MIVRPRDAQVEVGPAPLQRFVVPLDGSELAARALPVAERLARRTRLPIHLIRVLPVAAESWLPSFGDTTLSESMHDAALAVERGAVETLETAEAALAAAGVPTTSSLEAGDVVERIATAARPDDVIVLASHGESGLRRWALGSVAEKLVRHAEAPAIVVRAGTTTVA
jgi:nucleotide-binding universal stress UspA family protein